MIKDIASLQARIDATTETIKKLEANNASTPQNTDLKNALTQLDTLKKKVISLETKPNAKANTTEITPKTPTVTAQTPKKSTNT
jgi:hypothetical protein